MPSFARITAGHHVKRRGTGVRETTGATAGDPRRRAEYAG
jgi:hypothetical protein